MSFKKIQIIDPYSIGNPDDIHVYFGRDQYGYWEKDSNGNVLRITSGITIGSGSSGFSGKSGSSGVDGSFYGTSGTSGFSGSSGIDGISGSSGKTGTHGTSGTSGLGTSGSSGSSGLSSFGSSGSSGYSGSSGKDGSFYGSSGISGSSGMSGYGGSNRRWKFVNSSSPGYGEFYCDSNNLTNIYTIKINQIDADGQLLDEWLNSWTMGILKIEKFGDPSIFGIYSILDGYTTNIIQIPDINVISGLIIFNANGSFQSNENYLISYISSGNGSSGSSGVSPGVSTFLELSDTPDTYNGQSGKVAVVKEDETGLDFEKISLELETNTLTFEGIRVILTAGETLSTGDLCYMNNLSKMYKADADNISTSFCFAIATDTIDADATGVFLLFGIIGGFSSLTIGTPIFLSSTPGQLTQIQPTGSNVVIQIIGIAISSTHIYFKPELTQIELL